MGKIKRLFYLVFLLILSVPVLGHAKEVEYNPQSEYGTQLQSVPFVVRYKYQQDTGKKWADAGYDQRKSFLTDWHNGIAQGKAKADAEAKANAAALREKEKAKKAEAKQIRDKEREKARQKRAEEREVAQRNREFDRKVREKKRRIDELRREQAKLRKMHGN